MSQLDKLKETLNTLRAALAIIAALLIALGSGVGSLLVANNIALPFWIAISIMFLLILAAFLILVRIKEKTDKIGDL
jgi:O-antigen ligase